MIKVLELYEKLKQKVKKHKFKIIATVSVIAAGYFYYQSINDDKDIKLSSFFDALSNSQINEVIIQGSTVHFRSFSSQWYHSELGLYPISELFKILRQIPNITYSCERQTDTKPFILMAIPCVFSYLIYSKMFDDNKKAQIQAIKNTGK